MDTSRVAGSALQECVSLAAVAAGFPSRISHKQAPPTTMQTFHFPRGNKGAWDVLVDPSHRSGASMHHTTTTSSTACLSPQPTYPYPQAAREPYGRGATGRRGGRGDGGGGGAQDGHLAGRPCSSLRGC